MKSVPLTAQPLEQDTFTRFGDVIETGDTLPTMINDGMCARYHDLANVDICKSGSAGISLFLGQHYPIPVQLRHVERHPRGSQCFIPMSTQPFLVIVADDDYGTAQAPQVFLTTGSQGVNYHRNTWHGVLTPLYKDTLFTVIDYIGSGDNLQEHHYPFPYSITIT